ncbi:MFS transporter [Enterococcus sp. BWM-S5]|uniref:MFS transporter n=1 Tax=Enterococcus larvae TaxID=2794352 RepID=A0ABS4CND4_9ENTE|nr:MFS transporter [Enterococcus larvae]MBP1048096.1 MFS transporter [Enterococcus larvae]
MFKTLHPNIRARILIQFLSKVVGSMIFPFMAVYFTNELNSGIAGILVTVNVIIQFIAGIYGGHLTDLFGRRQLMIAGEALKSVAYLGMLLANSPMLHSVWLTFLMMLVVSVAQGMINPAADAMLIDVSTVENRAFMYSISYWVNNLSVLIGVMVGGWFFQSHLFLLLIALFLLSLLTTALTVRLLSETLAKQKRTVGNVGITAVFKSYQKVMHDHRFLLFTLGGIALMTVEYQRNNFVSVRLAEELKHLTVNLGALGELSLDGVRILSLLTAVNTSMIILFTGPIAKWVTGQAQRRIMYIGFLLFSTGYAVTAFSNQLLVLFTATVIFSFGELLYVPTRQTILAEIIDESSRGSYVAFNGIIFQLGKILASLSLMISPAIGKYGMAALIVTMGILAILLTNTSLTLKKAPSAEKLTDL